MVALKTAVVVEMADAEPVETEGTEPAEAVTGPDDAPDDP
jgi:hypothetical protein